MLRHRRVRGKRRERPEGRITRRAQRSKEVTKVLETNLDPVEKVRNPRRVLQGRYLQRPEADPLQNLRDLPLTSVPFV